MWLVILPRHYVMAKTLSFSDYKALLFLKITCMLGVCDKYYRKQAAVVLRMAEDERFLRMVTLSQVMQTVFFYGALSSECISLSC